MIQRCHSGIHPKDLYPGRPCSLLLCLQKPGDEYNMNEEEMKMWYTYAMKKRSAVKKKEPTKSTGKQMELETIILREIIQTQKDDCRMRSLIRGCEI